MQTTLPLIVKDKVALVSGLKKLPYREIFGMAVVSRADALAILEDSQQLNELNINLTEESLLKGIFNVTAKDYEEVSFDLESVK